MLLLHMFVALSPIGSYAADSAFTFARRSYLMDEFNRDTIRLHCRPSDSEIDFEYEANKGKLNLIDSLLSDTTMIIDSVYIFSSSSPEGDKLFNDALSEERGNALCKEISDKITADLTGEVKIIALKAGFDRLVTKLKAGRNFMYRGEIIAEFENNSDEDADAIFERVCKVYKGEAIRHIYQNVLPSLRYAELVIVSHPMPAQLLPFEEMLSLIEQDLNEEVEKVEDSLDQSWFGKDSLHAAQASEPTPQPQKKAKNWYPAVKTNLLYDAVTALNAELEFPIGKHLSIAQDAVFPWWSFGPNKNKYCFQILYLGIEPRWWFKRNDKRDYLSGHFIGVYGMSGRFDLQWDRKLCYQGYFWSSGISYGYALPVCSWLNMEFSISAGYLGSNYQHYQPDENYEQLYKDKNKQGRLHWVGPTKAKISLVIPIGRDSHNPKREKSGK